MYPLDNYKFPLSTKFPLSASPNPKILATLVYASGADPDIYVA
jgi:hypothetical protein